MTRLGAILDAVHRSEKQLVVYRSGGETDLEAQFASHRVDVVHRDLPPGGPEPFLIVSEGGKFAGALPLEDLIGLLEPPVVRPGAREDVSDGYRVLFEVLDETVFTTMERRALLTVSREIEERAFRVGCGTLHASFQQLSVFEPQVETYRRLADASELDIHVYGTDDWTPPAIDGVTYHSDAAEIDQFWTLTFDGCGDDTQACALLAREQAEGYEGCWTNDPETVRQIQAALVERNL
ncbi:histidine kinase [Halobellus sp. Atlit-31R]|nr:histidine kinase [Halobellus sp. Atlit-31R]